MVKYSLIQGFKLSIFSCLDYFRYSPGWGIIPPPTPFPLYHISPLPLPTSTWGNLISRILSQISDTFHGFSHHEFQFNFLPENIHQNMYFSEEKETSSCPKISDTYHNSINVLAHNLTNWSIHCNRCQIIFEKFYISILFSKAPRRWDKRR